MNNKFSDALKKSFSDLMNVDKDMSSINELIDQAANAIKVQSGNEVTLEAVTKTPNISSFLQNIVDKQGGAIGAKGSEIEKELIIKSSGILSETPDDQKIKLTTLKINKKGFPCSIVVNGDVNIAHDHETLEQYFVELLSDIETAKAIRKILKALRKNDKGAN